MVKDNNCSTRIRRKDRGLSTVVGSVLFLTLIVTISSILFVSLYRYNDNVQQAYTTEATRAQEQIILSNLTLANGYVTGVMINNNGSITSQIRAFYVDSIFVCDPSDPTLNPNGAYINSQDSQTINVQPVQYNPTAYITVATARSVKAIELESHLIGGSNSSSGAMDTNYGPLRLNFEKFYYRDINRTGFPIGPWQSGSNVSISTQYCAFNITVTNIDTRDVTLNQYCSLTLVPNHPTFQYPFYINNISLFIASNQTKNIIFVWATPLPGGSDAQRLQENDIDSWKVFLTCYGHFSDGSTYGQTIPFEAVILVKSYPSISIPTLTPPTPVPFGTPVTTSVTVSAPTGTPTGNVDFQVSTDGGVTFVNFGAPIKLSLAGTATSDQYVAPSTGNFQFRAIYQGDGSYFGVTSLPTSLTVVQAYSRTTVTLSSQLIPAEQSITVRAAVTPTGATGTVRFEISTDSGVTFTQLGSDKTLILSSATSDAYSPQVPGNNYRFRAIYYGDSNVLNSTSGQVALTASGALYRFEFNTINNQIAGAPFSITITAKDSYGFTVTNYTGSSTLTDSTGTINPITTGFFSAGIRTISVTIFEAATSVAISASDGVVSGTSDSFTINVSALDHFTFANINSPQIAGLQFTITITAQDAWGNTITGYTGSNGLTASTGSINPTLTGAFSGGTWTGNIILTGAATSVTIGTNGGSPTRSGTSDNFAVIAGDIDHFTFDTIGNQVTNTSFSITITAQDAYNNTVTSYSGINTLADLSGSISPTLTGVFSNGIWTGPVTITNSNPADTISTSGNGKSGTSDTFIVA